VGLIVVEVKDWWLSRIGEGVEVGAHSKAS